MVRWQVPSTKATCCGFESENQPLPKHMGMDAYQSPSPNPAELEDLCIGYDPCLLAICPLKYLLIRIGCKIMN